MLMLSGDSLTGAEYIFLKTQVTDCNVICEPVQYK